MLDMNIGESMIDKYVYQSSHNTFTQPSASSSFSKAPPDTNVTSNTTSTTISTPVTTTTVQTVSDSITTEPIPILNATDAPSPFKNANESPTVTNAIPVPVATDGQLTNASLPSVAASTTSPVNVASTTVPTTPLPTLPTTSLSSTSTVSGSMSTNDMGQAQANNVVPALNNGRTGFFEPLNTNKTLEPPVNGIANPNLNITTNTTSDPSPTILESFPASTNTSGPVTSSKQTGSQTFITRLSAGSEYLVNLVFSYVVEHKLILAFFVFLGVIIIFAMLQHSYRVNNGREASCGVNLMVWHRCRKSEPKLLLSIFSLIILWITLIFIGPDSSFLVKLWTSIFSLLAAFSFLYVFCSSLSNFKQSKDAHKERSLSLEVVHPNDII